MMSQPISTLGRLRAGTRDAHASIETVPALGRLLAADLALNEYVAVLQHLHAFHSHVEPAVRQELTEWPEAAAMLDGARPRALAEDLAWFGASAIPTPRYPALKGPAGALGALYVIEGSGLGGRVIARHLTVSIGVSLGAGGSFYCRQDAESARLRWQRLTGLLDLHVKGVVQDKIVRGAQETFRALEHSLRTIKIDPENVGGLAKIEAVLS